MLYSDVLNVCVRVISFVMYTFAQVGPEELAKAVLAEVPRQVVDYYRLANLSPAQSQGHA